MKSALIFCMKYALLSLIILCGCKADYEPPKPLPESKRFSVDMMVYGRQIVYILKDKETNV
jgi:hypothetical protein